MEKLLKERESNGRAIWVNEPDEAGEIARRRETAFNVALGKLLDTNGNLETVMQTGEAFGRGLFEDLIKEKPEKWTMEEWLSSTVEHIFNPLGNAFTFSKIADDEVKSLMTRCPLHENTNEPHVASLFTYGFMRGLLLSAFPQGELLMGDTVETEDWPRTKFIFKTNTLFKDRFERERVKSSFDITKKL
jgi:hypothetical protein